MKSDLNKNVKMIYKKIEPNFFNKYGYINLNHREVNTKEELVEIASIFRNPMYETFRIVYVDKESKIVGYESITSKAPKHVNIFPKSKTGQSTEKKSFYKIKDRMRRLNADGYYLVHNHPSGNAKASKDDLEVSESFYKSVDGYKGHLIVNTDKYAWIDVDSKYGIAMAENYIEIKKFKKDKYYRMLNKKSIYDVKIKTRTDFVMLMHHVKNSKDYSSLIYIDAQGKVRMIQDMPNRFLNMKISQMEGYIRNQKMLSGATRVLFATSDNDIYSKSLKFWEEGIFKDAVVYKEENEKIFTYEKLKVQKENLENQMSLFSAKQVSVSEDESEIKFDDFDLKGVEEYMDDCMFNIEEDEFEKYDDKEEKPKKKLKILMKQVGKEPEVMEIEDTLEAKQELVGGLIEIVQYDDVVLVCNEEGKLLNMAPNLIFDFDYIAGDCFIMGEDFNTGEWRSLSEVEIEKYKRELDGRSFRWRVEEKVPSKEKERGERSRGKN